MGHPSRADAAHSLSTTQRTELLIDAASVDTKKRKRDG